MDEGIIACHKQHYKKFVLCRLTSFLYNDKDFNFTLLDGVLTQWVLKQEDSEAVDEEDTIT